MSRRWNWGEDRVFYYDASGALRSFAASLTDLLSPDEFTRISAGRSAFRVDDLFALRTLLDRYETQGRSRGDV